MSWIELAERQGPPDFISMENQLCRPQMVEDSDFSETLPEEFKQKFSECIKGPNRVTFNFNPEFNRTVKSLHRHTVTETKRVRSKKTKRNETEVFLQRSCDFVSREIPDPLWNSRFCIERMWTILQRKELSHLKDRLISIWKLYLRKAPNGVFIKEIQIVKNILLNLNLNYEKSNFAQDLAKSIFDHLKKGLQLNMGSDNLETKVLSHALNGFAHILVTGKTHVQQGLMGVLLNWAERLSSNAIVCDVTSCPSSKSDKVELKPIARSTLISALENSSLPRTLAEIVKAGVHSLYADVLLLLRFLCRNSEKIRERLIRKPILEPLLKKLSLPDESNEILTRTTDLIYALFEKSLGFGSEEIKRLHVYNPGAEAFQTLLGRFIKQLFKDDSSILVDIRNDTLFLIYLLTRKIPPLRKRFALYACDLAGILSNNILNVSGIPFLLDSTPEGLDLLKYLVWILQLIIHSRCANRMIYDYQLVEVLICILVGPCPLLDDVTEDNPALEPLLNVVWQTLSTIAEIEPLAFLQKEGAQSMLEVLKVYSENGIEDINLISKFSHVLRVVLNHADDENIDTIVAYFDNMDALVIFINVLERMTLDKFTVAEETILCNILLSCAVMGRIDDKQRELFAQNKGVKIVTRLIGQLVYTPAHERHMNPLLHIAVAECIWRCICDAPSALEMFLAYEGVFLLLDLLEIAAGPAAPVHILSCLVQICEYPRCIDQLLFWKRNMKNFTQRFAHGDDFDLPMSRGPGYMKPKCGDTIGDLIINSDQSLSALFCELWRDEEKRFGVLRDADGCIAAVEKPLMSQYARKYQTLGGRKRVRVRDSEYPGPSCLDLISSVRPKIFLIVKKLTEATNTEATIFGGLSLANQVTMQVVINFLDLKRGEIWLEMMEELRQQNLNLVPSDVKAMNRFVKIAQNKVSVVIDTQHYLLCRAKEHDEINERELYELMKKCHLQDHLKAAKKAEYFARTSDYCLLVHKRLWQKTQLQRAVRKIQSGSRIHRTTDEMMNFTAWPSRNRAIETEPTFNEIDYDEKSQEIEVDEFDMQRTDSNQYKTPPAVPTLLTILPLGYPASPAVESLEDGDGGHTKHRRRGSLNPSATKSMTESPESTEEGFYTVSPVALKKALQQILTEQKKWGWTRNIEDENAWMIRTKWKQQWYVDDK